MLRNAVLLMLALIVVAIGIVWTQREKLAGNFIEKAFAEKGVEASYKIESISPRRQVLTDIVIGDPLRPDLTVERLVVMIQPRLGVPKVREIALYRPRIFGTLRNGELSFGQLDPFIFTGEEDKPFEFPDLAMRIEDGRGLIASDYGRVGLKLQGRGNLRGGFRGELAAVGPDLDFEGCDAHEVTLYGNISIDAERPRFEGPVRFDRVSCPDSDLDLKDGNIRLALGADRSLADFEGKFRLANGASSFGGTSVATLAGEGDVAWRDGKLNARYGLTGRDIDSAAARIASLQLDGLLRTSNGFDRIEVEGDLAGRDLRMGGDLDSMIADAAAASEGTLLAPLLNKLGLNLAGQLRGSELTASFNGRRIGERLALVVPEARLRGRSGETLLALSRLQAGMGGESAPRIAGNFRTGGAGLPQISGRAERLGNGDIAMNLAMREYASGSSRLAVPEMRLVQRSDGGTTLDGRVLANGPLPGGFAQGLVLPVDGTIGADGSIALWASCRKVRFDRLEYANLTLRRQSLTLCPPSGKSILRYGPGGLQIAAGASSLNLSGEFAGTPMALRSGPVGFAYPGSLVARNLDIALGPASTAQRFRIANLTADLSGKDISGDFGGTDVLLASVPLDVLNAKGTWRYAGERLTISNGAFRLEDRESADRFEPLVARGAGLTLHDNIITADALLRHPATDRAISRVDIIHNLATGRGHADLGVDGITFGDGFQPLDLSRLAFGVVANVEGTITGTGRINWNENAVTSTGSFSSEDLDFAAAFGPVKGASGTVEFTDLLGLTTAPNQRIRIAALNPGIEIYDGEIAFQLRNGEVIAVEGGTWPFLGGTLRLEPLNINLGVAESRTYVIVIEGLEAAKFIERMELNNISATGIFDGRIPIVFDENGNGTLENGILTSRPPGGNISYVGELTYEDLSFFANYAFQALRDLRYDEAEIVMNGPLTGELVTQVRFEGIGQGETAKKNFITRRLANLPIELRINIRARFYQLISSLRALYDPTAVRDPRSLGLVGADGQVLRKTVDQQTVESQDEQREQDEERRAREALGLPPDETDIQPRESENKP